MDCDINKCEVVIELRSLLREARCRLRNTAQILIAEIGATGPMNADRCAAEAVQLIKNLRAEICILRSKTS